MSGFFASLSNEMGARRRRLRATFGDRGQAIVEFLILGGLAIGSLGLLIGTWMPRVAPWGFALPFVFIAGFFLIEMRRQRALTQGGEAEGVAARADWAVVLWGLGCALAGVAAFVIAWQAQPRLNVEEPWTPPRGTVDSVIGRPN